MGNSKNATFLVAAVGLAAGGCVTKGVDVIQYGEMRYVLREGYQEPQAITRVRKSRLSTWIARHEARLLRPI